jgi:ATP-dependent DNA ligase
MRSTTLLVPIFEACDGDGMPVFDRLRYRRQDGRVFLYAFDLLELNGQDMRAKR